MDSVDMIFDGLTSIDHATRQVWSGVGVYATIHTTLATQTVQKQWHFKAACDKSTLLQVTLEISRVPIFTLCIPWGTCKSSKCLWEEKTEARSAQRKCDPSIYQPWMKINWCRSTRNSKSPKGVCIDSYALVLLPNHDTSPTICSSFAYPRVLWRSHYFQTPTIPACQHPPQTSKLRQHGQMIPP